MKKLGFIGCGVMGSALARGIHNKFPEVLLGFFDKDRDLAAETAGSLGGEHFETLGELLDFGEASVIAVKPQHLETLFDEIGSKGKNRSFISVVAGKPAALFSERLQTKEIVRCMPNIGAKVGQGVIGIAGGNEVSTPFYESTARLLGAAGTTFHLQEEQMAAITGLAGSGIAFVFDFLHAMALGGTEAGIPYQSALEITLATVQGAVDLLRHEKEHPAALLTRVTSAGGTTIKGIKALEKGGFRYSIMEAVTQAARRAEELE